jgi:hypothetical protein
MFSLLSHSSLSCTTLAIPSCYYNKQAALTLLPMHSHKLIHECFPKHPALSLKQFISASKLKLADPQIDPLLTKNQSLLLPNRLVNHPLIWPININHILKACRTKCIFIFSSAPNGPFSIRKWP